MKNDVNRALVAKKKFSKISLTLLAGFLLTFAFPSQGWGGHSTHYGKVVAGKVTNAANGTVYVATSSTKPATETTSATWNCGGSSGSDTKTCYWWATSNDGYYCEGWYSAQAGTGSAAKTTANFSESVTATGTSSSKATTKTYYAKFEPVAISLYDGQAASENIDAQYAKHAYTGSVSFGTTGADAIADFVAPAFENKEGNGVYTMTGWGYANNKVSVDYSFSGNGAAGTTTAELVLKSAGQENSKKVSFTAISVAPTITSGEANNGKPLTPAIPTDLAEGTATFNVTNAEDASYFAPTFSNVQGGGTWKIVSTSYSAGVYTVDYSFQSDAEHLGDHSADLTLTATVGSATKTVTATAFTEAIATEDAKVTSSTGTLIYQGDWATALSKANANANCTLTLLRNVDVTAQQNVTNTFTLDLNGKKLSNTNLSESPTNILYINGSGKTLTIKDSKSGGEVHGVGSRNNALYAIYVNSGHLILNGGKLYIENTMVYVKDVTGKVEADGVRAAAKMTITMNGGEVEAVADRNAKGLQNNGSGSDTSNGITINGGSIYAHASKTTGQYAYGIYNYGKLTVNGGTIEGHADKGYGYGIFTNVSPNATQASNYAGTTIINDGIITGSSGATYAYGVYANASMATNTTSTTDGTLSNKASSRLTVNGGKIVATSAGRYCYGIVVLGDYNSYNPDTKTDGHWTSVLRDAVVEATGSQEVYGIQASTTTSSATGTEVNGDVELYNMDVTARTTTANGAYAAWSVATSRTITETKSGYYPGEYASQGGKLTIYSGNYKAYSGVSTAYAVGSSTRSRTVAGNASGYSTLIIHGGDFFAETAATEARAICSGGWTTVDGGTFTAHAKTTTARGVMVVSGKTTLNNVSFDVLAETGSAFGLCAWADVADKTLVTNAGELVANNVTVVAKTNSGNTAEAVRVHTARRALATVNAGYVPGDFTISSKATINGGNYTAIAAGTTAYGIYSVASPNLDVAIEHAWPELEVHDATFTATTKGTTTAYGARIGGPTIIDNCTFNVAAQTETAYGLLIDHKKTTVSNSTFNVSATTKAYGIYANAAVADKTGFATAADVESTNNTYTVNATATTTAYGAYVHSVKRLITSTAAGYTPGDYASAATVYLTDDKMDVTAATTTARAVYTRGLAKPSETSEVGAMARATIDGGKYKATATSTVQDVFNETPKASDGYYPPEGEEPILIKGGFFKNEANLDFYKAPGLYVNDLKSGVDAEYAEGYRFEVGAPRFGTPVCKNGSKTYLTLEAALEDVNNGTVNGGTIVMTLPYTLPAGNYKIPSNTTLLVPYKSGTGKGADQAIGTKAQTTDPSSITAVQTPSCYLLLTLASGAHIDVYGTIEASAQQFDYTTSSGTSIVYGPYGQIHMEEGSSMSLENGAKLQAWGYITGKGETTAHRGSTVIENFQVFDWKGGKKLANGFMSGNSAHKVFPVNQYFIQSVESPVIYRPGSHLTSSFHTSVTYLGTQGSDDVGVVGEWRSNSDKDVALFLMDAADMSDDTWVRKEYDAVNDVQLYTVNSTAMLSAMKINTGTAGTVNSAEYDLPLGSNFKIVVNSGKLQITQDVQMFAGAEIEVYKEGDLQINSGCKVYLWDKDEWGKFAYSGKYVKTVSYCPSWKTSPRYAMQDSKAMLNDATINLHGSMTIIGGLYTTNGGASIISNNKDAGKIMFHNTTAATNTSVYQVSTYNGDVPQFDNPFTATPAQLKNEDGSFTSTVGANNGKTYAYSKGRWQCWEQVGCYQVDKSDDANWKWYANPSDFVQVKSNETDNHVAPVMDEDHLYPSADETRFFILMDGCMWWEVSLVDDELCYSEMNDTYYQWDGSKWVIKSFVITWKDWNGTTLDTYNNVKYRSMPKWLSATPTKTKQAGDPAGSYYIFSGWTPDLDVVTENATYTATYELIVPKYDVLWKNEDGSKTLHISRWAEGEHPAYDGAEIKKATSMVGVDLAHNGWSTAANGTGTRYGLTDELPAMGTTAQTYYATFAEGYIITWKNENGDVLDSKLWATGTRPTHEEIIKESDEQYDYVFAGWTPEILPVEADAEYTAVFTPVLRQYAITFSNLNGKGSSQIVYVDYGATPVCPVTPDRGNSAEYSYEWTGWKDAAGNTFGTDYIFPVVSGDATYTATFSQTTRTYTVTWKNEDGSVLERVRGLARGDAVPDYSGTTPEKEPTRYLTYGFAGWTPAKKATIDESGDQEYRATFDAGSTRYYTVSWLMDDGDLINKSYLEYDQMPTHANPTKASTTLYSYDFAGWTPAISAVKGDAEYKATFNAIHRQYEITYVLYDDVKNVVRYEAEAAVATPATPTREGYTFVRWNPEVPATMPAEDMECVAQWTKKKYTLTWNLDDGNVKTPGTPAGSVEWGTSLIAPVVEKTGYTFAGWTPEVPATMPTENATYTAQWVELDPVAEVIPAGSTIGVLYYNWDEALAAANASAGCTLRLLADVESLNETSIIGVAMNLDLNSHTISGTTTNLITINTAAKTNVVTITDGSTDKQGRIELNANSNSRTSAVYVKVGTLNVEAGTIHATNTAPYASNTKKRVVAVYNNGQVVNVQGGTLLAESDTYAFGLNSKGGTATLSGGDVIAHVDSARAYGVYVDTTAATININNATIYAYNNASGVTGGKVYLYGVYIYKSSSKLYVNSGANISAQSDFNKGTYIYGVSVVSSATATINPGSKIEAIGKSTYVYGLNNAGSTTITGGEISASGTGTLYGLYSTGKVMNVTGGTITATGSSSSVYGIDIANQTATIENCVVNAKGKKSVYGITAAASLNSNSGAASCGVVTVNEGVEVNVNATTTSTSSITTAAALYVMSATRSITDKGVFATAATMTVNGGTYTTTSKTTSSYGVYMLNTKTIGEGDAKLTVTPTLTINNGRFKATGTQAYNAFKIEEDAQLTDNCQLNGGYYVDNANLAPFVPTDKAVRTLPSDHAEYANGYRYSIEKGYKVTFLDDNTIVLKTIDPAFVGDMPSCDDPTKDATAQYTYTFNGWTPTIVAVTGDATYTATYTATKNRYAITFQNEDGAELQKTEVEYGATPSYTGDTPTKTATAEYTYTFKGWDKEIVAVTGAATYTATYTATKNKYAITFQNEDGAELQKTEVEYGATPSYTGDTPTKTATTEYTYTFNDWDKEIVAVTGAATYTATYTATKNKYAITFQNEDGAELQKTEVEYGATPSYTGETPTKTATAEYTYTFKGWDKEIVAVTGAATYTATYTATKNKYSIIFQNEDGAELQKSDVEYGAMPSYTGATPTKAATTEYTYTFNDWDKEIVAVTGAATYTATYTATKNKYSIIFQNEDGAELQKSDVEYGAMPSYTGATPTKAATAEYTYTFNGWTPSIVAATANATYTATYTQTKNKYTLTWNLDGGEVTTAGTDAGSVEWGTSLIAPVVEKTGYIFAGWTPEVPATMPTENATYTAQWQAQQEVTYKVNHYYESALGVKEQTPFRTDEGYGLVGAQVSADDVLKLEGYDSPDPSTQTIAADGSTVVEYYYRSRNLNVTSEVVIVGADLDQIVVENNGTLSASAPSTAKRLVLTATPGNNDGANANLTNISISESVCIEIEMNSTRTMDDKLFYCFSVPFKVNVDDGVERLHKDNNTWSKAVLNTNYRVYTYNEYDRATNGRQDSNWKEFSGTQFLPGVFYLCEFDNSNYNRYRFYAADKTKLNNKSNIAVTHTGDATNGGWNGVANNGLTDNQLSGDFTYIQTLNSEDNCFEAAEASEKPLAIGNAAMVQVSASGSVVVGETSSAVAARRMGEAASTEFINVRLYKENQDKHVDQIFIRASEDASEQYVAGIDLSKATMGTPKVARMWVNDYNLQLVANEALMTNDQAIFSLGMSAPANGEYTIAIDDTPNDAIVYLTMNGSAIWNLNIAPAPISLSKGTENSYGLRLVRKINNVVTGFDEAVLNGNVQKVILNDHLYIIRDGKVYSAHGHVIK